MQDDPTYIKLILFSGWEVRMVLVCTTQLLKTIRHDRRLLGLLSLLVKQGLNNTYMVNKNYPLYSDYMKYFKNNYPLYSDYMKYLKIIHYIRIT